MAEKKEKEEEGMERGPVAGNDDRQIFSLSGDFSFLRGGGSR